MGFRLGDDGFKPFDVSANNYRDAFVGPWFSHEFVGRIGQIKRRSDVDTTSDSSVEALDAPVGQLDFPAVTPKLVAQEHRTDAANRGRGFQNRERIPGKRRDVSGVCRVRQFTLLEDSVAEVVDIAVQRVFRRTPFRPPLHPIVSDVFEALKRNCYCPAKNDHVEQTGLSMGYVDTIDVGETTLNVRTYRLGSLNDFGGRSPLGMFLQVRLRLWWLLAAMTAG